jgi:Protein of unknown function (DUF3604)
MPELTRDAVFDALHRRRHYGTSGVRIFMDLSGSFEREVTGFSEDPQLGPATEFKTRLAMMGDIIRPANVAMHLAAEVIGTARIERVDVMHGTEIARTIRPFTGADLGRRIRLMWQGAEYRGRGRETLWQGKLRVADNRSTRFAPVNFLNPERTVSEIEPGAALVWSSVTTGNLAGIDLWLDRPQEGVLNVETNIVSGDIDLASLGENVFVFEGGGLGRQLRVYRLPEGEWSRRVSIDHKVRFAGGKDLPVYLRLTQADGHQAWSSPIYLIE